MLKEPIEFKCGCFLVKIIDERPFNPYRKRLVFNLCVEHSEDVDKFLVELNLQKVKNAKRSKKTSRVS